MNLFTSFDTARLPHTLGVRAENRAMCMSQAKTTAHGISDVKCWVFTIGLSHVHHDRTNSTPKTLSGPMTP
jgi:hypothetical protein